MQRQLAGEDAGVAQLAAGVTAAVAVQNGVAAVVAHFQRHPLGRDVPGDGEGVRLDGDGGGHQLGEQFLRIALAFQILRLGGAAAGDAMHRLDGPHHGADVHLVLPFRGQ